MCGRLDTYLKAFAKLHHHDDRIMENANADELFPAAPLVLLAVSDLIAKHIIVRNFIEPSRQLLQCFKGYTALISTNNCEPALVHAFLHLERVGVWVLSKRDERDRQLDEIRSVDHLRECYFGAKFTADLFPLLQMRSSREKLGTILIQTYFSSPIQSRLREYSSLGLKESERSINHLT